MSYMDSTLAGRSKRVPYTPGEDTRKRHGRRFDDACASSDEMAAWCRERGVGFRVGNWGSHWQFRLPDGRLVEWWPSTAKLVIAQQWGYGIHTHDIEQVQAIIQRELDM